MNDFPISQKYLVPEILWLRIEPIIRSLPEKNKKKCGRPRMNDRKAFNAIFYILRTGCQWKALPRCLGASSTVHDRFQYWVKLGLFSKLWHEGLLDYEFFKGIDWQFQSADGCHVQAPLGGENVGPSYKHRGKNGSNRSLLTDAKGIPLALIVAAANRNDFKLLQQTLDSFAIQRPNPQYVEQHICLDKGYDYPEVEDIVEDFGYTAHIRRKGEDNNIKTGEIPKYRSKRWVVERTHSWINHFRRLIIRWEKKADNFLALLHFACAWISFRATRVFGI